MFKTLESIRFLSCDDSADLKKKYKNSFCYLATQAYFEISNYMKTQIL